MTPDRTINIITMFFCIMNLYWSLMSFLSYLVKINEIFPTALCHLAPGYNPDCGEGLTVQIRTQVLAGRHPRQP